MVFQSNEGLLQKGDISPIETFMRVTIVSKRSTGFAFWEYRIASVK